MDNAGPSNNAPNDTPKPSRLAALTSRTINRAMAWWRYVSADVWKDSRRTWKVNLVKTLNLTVRSFMDADLQTQACALTYRTVLAVVPALALIFAICRGFGFQNLLQSQLYSLIPSQHQALEVAMKFVDSYLAQASEGVFVGIGIIFLLWTLISLLSSVEDSFNTIWQVREGRTIWRKVTDYLAIFLVLPVLMICAGGITIVMSTALKKLVFFDFLGPVVNICIDALGLFLTWLFFAGAYMLIPNAKVHFKNAFVAGAIVGTSFQIIQWLFITGQMYVTKYNAIYGSFSFLPLMLLWLQLSWLATLIGSLVCFASQNIGQFSFYQDVDNISIAYRRRASLALMTIIARRFALEKPPMTVEEIAMTYKIPEKLVRSIVLHLREVGLVAFAETKEENGLHPLLPALDLQRITVAETVHRLEYRGSNNFIPDFDARYASILAIADDIERAIDKASPTSPLSTLEINLLPTT